MQRSKEKALQALMAVACRERLCTKSRFFEQHAAGAPEEQDVYSSSGLLTVGAPAERDVLVSQAITSRS
jgi:hypothetical protein